MIALLRWFRHMLLWRGHSPVNIRIPRFSWRSGISPLDRISRPVTLLLPVRSMFAFAWGVAISRNFELIPSFVVWALGWFMVVSATVGRDHPNPWNRPRTFGELLHVLVFGRTPRRPPIVSNQNQAEIQNYQEEEQRKKEVYERILDNLRKEEERLLGTDVFDDADVAGGDLDLDIAAKAAAALAQMTLLSPFSSTLLPLQMRLHEVCVNFRKAKSVFLWRDSYISFWIVIACGAGSLILAFVPWAFILKWTFTVSVWVFLGPWMKLVDIFFIRPRQTEEQGQEDLTKKFKNKYKRMLGLSIQNKLKREADIKERDIRRYMFGKVRLCLA